ncbi:hypothetical protein EYB53_000730 [Candidatus Chloroploca sp. M-50]|uniref:Sulfotransferase n=1 Tax=Candidatus Chloroploca mongolica TaxID=2528176 RepID=A0ABS4D468_9CHLR|nr:hypothetical protein [Candidatus Chloroploca mongolica]MBP1464220.1 hypothetical protein [Candidatus Chloroploca mongolica]
MTNFVIFGTARSGSQLLVSLLNSHPAICCELEILRLGQWRRPLRPLVYLWQRIPYPYFIYRSRLMRKRTQKGLYGFKLFPYQVAAPASVVREMHRRGWKIIHLQRRSLFQQTLSGAVAGQTRWWHGRIGVTVTPPIITIDPKAFLASLLDGHNQREQCIHALTNVEHLDILYEADLKDEARWAATVERICSHLGVANAPVRTRLTKPWSQSYREIVSNYDELVKVFEENSFLRDALCSGEEASSFKSDV